MAIRQSKSAGAVLPKRNVVPDKLDLRDRPYMPAVAVLPPPLLKPGIKLLVMNQGAIVERGSADAIYADPQNEYTRKLMNAIPRGFSGR